MVQITLGPDGRYALGGPQFDGDKGGVFVALGTMPAARYCYMNFGTELTHFAVTPESAIETALGIINMVEKRWGHLPYNVDELPLKVTVFEDRIVNVQMTELTGVLCANPECFLALAQRMLEAAHQINGVDSA